jgi:hypothetical protein
VINLSKCDTSFDGVIEHDLQDYDPIPQSAEEYASLTYYL